MFYPLIMFASCRLYALSTIVYTGTLIKHTHTHTHTTLQGTMLSDHNLQTCTCSVLYSLCTVIL